MQRSDKMSEPDFVLREQNLLTQTISCQDAEILFNHRALDVLTGQFYLCTVPEYLLPMLSGFKQC